MKLTKGTQLTVNCIRCTSLLKDNPLPGHTIGYNRKFLLGRWVTKLVSHLLATNSENSQKYKMGEISKGVANIL
jgi:hypothetical protein